MSKPIKFDDFLRAKSFPIKPRRKLLSRIILLEAETFGLVVIASKETYSSESGLFNQNVVETRRLNTQGQWSSVQRVYPDKQLDAALQWAAHLIEQHVHKQQKSFNG